MPEHLIDRALLEPVGRSGRFQRQASTFRDWVSDDGSTPYPAVAGRYHLYVSWACPWAHRTIIGRMLKGLEDVIGMSVVDPIRDERGWAFTGGEYIDPVNGFRFLGEAYAATDPAHKGAPQRAGPLGHRDEADRQQRVRRRPADVHDRVRRARDARVDLWPGAPRGESTR